MKLAWWGYKLVDATTTNGHGWGYAFLLGKGKISLFPHPHKDLWFDIQYATNEEAKRDIEAFYLEYLDAEIIEGSGDPHE